MLPTLLKATFSNPGFPPGFYEIGAQGGLRPCLVQGTTAGALLTTSTTAVSNACQKKPLVNDYIKDRKEKDCWEDYLISEFVYFTQENIFFAWSLRHLSLQKGHFESQGFAEDLTVFAPWYSRAQQGLSSQQFPSHEP